MANQGFLSKRVKRTPQVDITPDRYQFLGLEQAEPNLGDPLVGPSSIGANPLPPGEVFILVATATSEGGRFWYPLSETDTEYASYAGIATYAITAGIATYATSSGISTYATSSDISTYATSSGISTYATSSGIATYADFAGVSTNVIGGIASVTNLNVSGDGNFTGVVTANSFVSTNAGTPNITSPNDLYLNANLVSISTNLSIGGQIVSDLNVTGNGNFSGVVTATTFVGTLDGNASTSTYATSAGIATNSDKVLIGTYSGNQNHYVGFFTSQSGYTSVRTNGLIYNPFSGRLSAGIFSGSHVGDGSGLTNVTAVYSPIAGIATYATTAGVSTNVIGGIASVTNLNVSGISTLGIVTANQVYVSGVVTATAFYGSGGNLTDLILSKLEGITIKDEGNIVGSASSFATIDFVGDYVTATGVGTTAVITFSTPAYSQSSGIATYASTAGISTQSTKLQTPRTFSITGDIVGSGVTFDGTGNVSIAATIQPNSVGLGTDTFGDYVKTISGTVNEVEVTSSTGEGSSPVVGLPNNVTIQNDLTVNNNVVIDGNLTVNGTQVILNVVEQLIEDKNIVLGYSTSHNETDTSANYGGISIASTEGSPLVNLSNGDISSTYKQITWVKGGTLGTGTTDAWLFNYGVGIGSTQVKNGVRLAVGSAVTVSDDSVSANYFYGNLSGTATSSINLSGGTSYAIPYQENVGITSFLSIGPESYVLSVSSGKPEWRPAAASGAIEGITLLDNGVLVGSASSISLINFVGNNLSIDSIGVGATITFTDQQYVNYAGIATYASIAGISTYSTSSGIATYATSAGIATVAQGLTGTPNIVVGSITATTGNFTGIVTANSFISSSGFIKAPDGTNSFYMYSTSGDVSFQGKIIASEIRSSSNLNSTISISDLDVNFGRNANFPGIVTAFDYNTTSDRRLKENINKIENSLEIVSQINGVTFNWKENKKQSAGVIAQDVEAVIPELVTDGETKTVNYNGLIGLLIESVKTLKEENLELKEQLRKLNSKVFGDT